jgi:hypothetical protein
MIMRATVQVLHTHLHFCCDERLGDDAESVVCRPRDQDLSGSLAQTVGDFLDGRRIDDARFTSRVVAHGGVCGDLYPLILA